VVNSEYVLRCLNIQNGKVSSVTSRGVIYNYELQNDYIIASYTDAYTPKSLVKIHGTAITNITGKEPDLDILIQRKHVANLSPAFILSQRNYDKPAGVILYFHPDFTSDFSPRFDPILMSLCMANYIVIAPNYPMSSGFGKKYYNSGLPDAVRDMNGWKRYLKKTFDLNLYYLAVSSGNILMESSMAEESDGVAAFASLFGIPSQDPGYQVPGLYILGENDARVNSFNRRASIGGSHNLEVVIYPNEGHWFRYEKNTQDALNRIIDLYQSND
jgi:dipeptidyl aminopeptidase/acylaminoacyl peptidase